VNGLLDTSPFGAVLRAVTASGSSRQLVERYVHDYTQMVYTPHSSTSMPDKELEVFRISNSYHSISITLYLLTFYDYSL